MKETNYKIEYIPTGNIFELSKTECDRLIIEESNNFKVVDKNYVAPVPESIVSSIQSQIIVDDGKEEKETGDLSPYAKFLKKEFEAEFNKRGLDFSIPTNNTEREEALLKNDAELKIAKETAERDALIKFEALKLFAETLNVPVEEIDTLNTLQAKVDAKKAEMGSV